VGGLLVSSLVVIPVITALQYSLGFKNSLFLSVVFSVLSVWLGLILAYYQNLPSGGSIVVVSISFFVLSFLANWKK
jgi:zinc transport system permease protein